MRHENLSLEGELALIKRAARGDHEAFRALVVCYESRLLAYIAQMIANPEDAHDVAQETFVSLFYSLPRWQPPDQSALAKLNEDDMRIPCLLAPWLYRIATNCAISLLRKRTVRARVHISVNADEDEEDEQQGMQWGTRSLTRIQPSFEESYVANELLQEALSYLPTEDAACLVLHYVGGERYKEIAGQLGLTSEAVRKRVARALIVLREVYINLDKEVASEQV